MGKRKHRKILWAIKIKFGTKDKLVGLEYKWEDWEIRDRWYFDMVEIVRRFSEIL